jgi:hypothetical protein
MKYQLLPTCMLLQLFHIQLRVPLGWQLSWMVPLKKMSFALSILVSISFACFQIQAAILRIWVKILLFQGYLVP